MSINLSCEDKNVKFIRYKGTPHILFMQRVYFKYKRTPLFYFIFDKRLYFSALSFFVFAPQISLLLALFFY